MPRPNLSSLRGQRVLITGAARGIGAALAQRLAARGVRLALVGLEPETLAEVARRCGPDTFTAECDVSSYDSVAAAVDAAAAALGGLDAVVANAGIAAAGPLRTHDLHTWQRVIEVNLLGVMHTDRATLPHLERSRGYLLNIASSAAIVHPSGLSAYCAAKAGVEAMTDSLRIEMIPLGVDVGVAYFAFLSTDMVNELERENSTAARMKREMPALFGRTYRLAPAVEELVEAVAVRRRRVAYPRWVLWLLPIRQLFASRFGDRHAVGGVAESLREHERLIAERGAGAATATERTRQVAGL